MHSSRTFIVKSVKELERFLIELNAALLIANPRDWPDTESKMEKMAVEARARLKSGVPNEFTMRIIDSDDRIIWEQADRFRTSTLIELFKG